MNTDTTRTAVITGMTVLSLAGVITYIAIMRFDIEETPRTPETNTVVNLTYTNGISGAISDIRSIEREAAKVGWKCGYFYRDAEMRGMTNFMDEFSEERLLRELSGKGR